MTNRIKNIPEEKRIAGLEKARQFRKMKAIKRRAEVARLFSAGKSKAEIARHLGVNWQTVNRDIKKIQS